MSWLTRPHIPEGREGVAAQKLDLSGKATFFFYAVTCSELKKPLYGFHMHPITRWISVVQQSHVSVYVLHCILTVSHLQTAKQDFPTAGWEVCTKHVNCVFRKKNLLTQKHLYFDIKRNGLTKKQNKNILKKNNPKMDSLIGLRTLKKTCIDHKYSSLCFTSKTN